MKNVFFDTEFSSLNAPYPQLLSIGLVAEGSRFYAEVLDFDDRLCSAFVKENVLPKFLGPKHYSVLVKDNCTIVTGLKKQIRVALEIWLRTLYQGEHEKFKLIGDCLSIDYILLKNLLGADTFYELFWYIPADICTMFEDAGVNPDISREEFSGLRNFKNAKHRAIDDAQIIQVCYENLKTLINNKK